MMQESRKKVLLSPLDPVHDVGIRMIQKRLEERGHETILLSTDLDNAEIVEQGLRHKVDIVLLSRSISYGAAELLSGFIDLAEASGLREKAKIGIGGKAIKPEFAAELGFDAVFGPQSDIGEAVAFVEGGSYQKQRSEKTGRKADLTAGFDYKFKEPEIERLVNETAGLILDWAGGKTSPAVERARLRAQMYEEYGENPNELLYSSSHGGDTLWREYLSFCDESVVNFYLHRVYPPGIRAISPQEQENLGELLTSGDGEIFPRLAKPGIPLVWIQYGTGCPILDVLHVKTCESWGAEGVIHIDSSGGSRTEGLMEGYLSRQGDGSIITLQNFRLFKSVLNRETQFLVRAHRGLNSPETVLTGAKAGADYTKLNIFYGSLHGGTDPQRLTVDTLESIRLAAKYNLPFDIPANDELSGVATAKSFAGVLVMLALGRKLGARPILKPLFCYSPDIMVKGYMKSDYIDYNAAKVSALRAIVNAPVWAGEPVGFMTHEEDRAQSCITTALHAVLIKALGIPTLTVASSDEAYSGGPISLPSRIDTLRGVAEAYRFFGECRIEPTSKAGPYTEKLIEDITEVLANAVRSGDYAKLFYGGIFGGKSEGASPGLNGKDTVFKGGR